MCQNIEKNRKTVTCACCGEKSEQITVTNVDFLEKEVDFTEKNGHHDVLMECPACGYVSEDLEKEISDELKKFVFSEEYRSLIGKARLFHFDKHLQKWIFCGMLSEKEGRLKRAGIACLMMAWRAEELGLSTASKMYTRAATNLNWYLEDEGVNKNTLHYALCCIYCWRKAKLFENAAGAIEHLLAAKDDLDMSEYFVQMLKKEETLVQKRDAKTD